MRAAKIKEHPGFLLMKQTDVQSIYYMQMPRWLFSDPRYADMNLDAKVTYTFLLNRFQLSRRKGWVNDQGEVFVIFPRLALAEELRICEKRVTAAFRALAERELIWEKRCGRGDANQIYLAKVEPQDDPAYQCAPFLTEGGADSGSRTADSAVLSEDDPPQEPQDRPLWTGENGGFGTAEPAVLEPQDQPSSKKERRKKNGVRKKSVSLSVPTRTDWPPKKNLRIFWTPASSTALSRKPPRCLKTPLSGFFIPTASGSATPRSRKAGSGPSCGCWMGWSSGLRRTNSTQIWSTTSKTPPPIPWR